jgi:putative FmdB family regulatory protein
VPIYEYECGCGEAFEELSRVGEASKPCPRCGKAAAKVPSRCSFKHGATAGQRAARDTGLRHGEMREDLKERYGVHGIQALPNSEGRGFEQVYKDIKETGSKVKDDMQATRACNQSATRAKQRRWMEGALKRTPKKRQQMIEKRAQEAGPAIR